MQFGLAHFKTKRPRGPAPIGAWHRLSAALGYRSSQPLAGFAGTDEPVSQRAASVLLAMAQARSARNIASPVARLQPET
jgi:hypothetical protein